MDLTRFVNLITTAVNLSLTRTLAQRLNQFHQSFLRSVTTSDQPWINRTSAGRAINTKRLESLFESLATAKATRDSIRTQQVSAASEAMSEAANPTGRDLDALVQSVHTLTAHLNEADRSVTSLTSEYDQLRALMAGQSYGARFDAMTAARGVAQSQHDSLKEQLSNKRQMLQAAYESDADPDAIRKLQDELTTYESYLQESRASLQSLDSQQDRLREELDRHVQVRHKMTETDKALLDKSTGSVTRQLSERSTAEKKYNVALNALLKEMENPSGLSTKQLQKMGDAVNRYEEDLQKASAALEKATDAHADLAASLDQRATDQIASGQRERAEQSAITRQSRPGRMRQAIGAIIRRRLGPQTRSWFRRLRNPKLAREAADKAASNLASARARQKTARSTYRVALREQQQSLRAYRKSPSAETRSTYQAATNKVAASKTALNTANIATRTAASTAAATASTAALAAAAGAAGFAISAVTNIISALADAVAKTVTTVVFFSTVMEKAAEAEVSRISAERTRFSGSVAGAVARYDLQKIQLESRSTQATAGSAVGLVEATMSLKESMQKRNERWENLMNTGMATLADIGSALSNIWDRLDVFTPAVEMAIANIREGLKFLGVKLTDIDKNTKPETNVALSTLKQFRFSNVKNRDKKGFDPPQKPVK